MKLQKIIMSLIGCESESPDLTKILDDRFKIEEIYNNGIVKYSNGRTIILYDSINKKRVDNYANPNK